MSASQRNNQLRSNDGRRNLLQVTSSCCMFLLCLCSLLLCTFASSSVTNIRERVMSKYNEDENSNFFTSFVLHHDYRALQQQGNTSHDNTTMLGSDDGGDRSDIINATIMYTLISFISNFGVAITGFGMAMIFWLGYTFADVIGIMDCAFCGVKESAFLQALSLTGVTPLLLWQNRNLLKKSSNKTLLTAFIPATIIATPVGQLLQRYLNAEIVRFVVGSVILGLSSFQVLQIIRGRKSPLDDDYDDQLSKDEERASSPAPILEPMPFIVKASPSEEAEKTEDMSKDSQSIEMATSADTDKDCELGSNSNSNNNAKHSDNGDKDHEVGSNINTDNNNEHSSDNSYDNNSQQEKGTTVTQADDSDDDATFDLPHVTGVKFWILSFFLGFVSGFLGGLSGLRSGPMLLFFLHYQYPKSMIRANIMIATVANTYTRMVYYIIEDLAGINDASSRWFNVDLWYLYICLIIAGLLGVPLGTWTEKRIPQKLFKIIIAGALVVSGLFNVVKGGIDIIAWLGW